MALTPQKVSTLTDATKPLADSVIAYVVQGVNSRKTTLGDIRRSASYTISSLPTPATAGTGAIAYCTDATGGAVPVYCDGSNWKRFDTNAVVS